MSVGPTGPPCIGRVLPRFWMTIVSSTHMSPGKRNGCTVEALYAMSIKRRNGRAAVAPTWTP